jgi:hypothetical protein
MTEFEQNEKAVYKKPYKSRGQELEIERKSDASTKGSVIVTTDQAVQYGSVPEDPEYLKLEDTVYNDKNSNQSRRRTVTIEEAYTNTSGKVKALEELGAERVIVTVQPVDLTSQAALTAAGANSLTLLESDVKRLDQVNGEKTTVNVESWQQRIKETFNDPELYGGHRKEYKQVKALDAAFDVVSNTLTKQRIQLDSAKELQIITAISGGGGEGPGGSGVYTDYEEEPTSGKRVVVTRELVASSAELPEDALPGLVVTLNQITDDLALKVTRTIDETILEDTFTEYHHVDFYFPAYLDAVRPILFLGGNMSPNKSGDQNLKMPCRFEVTYHETAQGPDTIFQFKTIDLYLVSPNVKFIVNDVISDDGAYHFTFGSSFYWEWFGSSPTTTEYLALMGEEVLISDDTVKWKYNLWRRTKIFMTLPELSEGFGDITYEP